MVLHFIALAVIFVLLPIFNGPQELLPDLLEGEFVGLSELRQLAAVTEAVLARRLCNENCFALIVEETCV